MRRLLLIAVALGLGGVLWRLGAPVPPPPGPGVRGASLGLFATDPGYDYDGMLAEMVVRGATDVLLVVPVVQTDVGSHDLALVDGRSPSLPTLVRTARQAKARGLRWGLLPIVRLAERSPDQWRGVLAPEAGADAWFTAYRAATRPLLEVARDEGAVRYGIGSELSSLERHDAAWRALADEARIAGVPEVFYAANWDRVDAVPFWDAVDGIGLSGYFELASEGGPTDVASLRAAWRGPSDALAATAARTGHDVLFVEIGYPAHALAAARPWDHTADAPLDLALQARLWRAFCDTFHDQPHVRGFYAWNWFGWGGPRDPGYTPRGKPAAAELARCWAEPWHAGAPSSP